MQDSEKLTEMIATLSSEQRAAVEEFIRYLREPRNHGTTFRSALDSFVREHEDLLRRLAR